MQLSSYIFILLFLPLTVSVRILLSGRGSRAGMLWLIFAGAVFYAWGGWESCCFLLLSLVVNGFAAFLMSRVSHRRVIYISALAFNLLSLAFYKYAGRLVGLCFGEMLSGSALSKLALPLGISFFTFQQLSYLTYAYNNPEERFLVPDYLLYILYFPKLLMGPLTEPSVLLPQLRRPELAAFNASNLVRGIKLFSVGLCKKLILADTFSKAAAWLLSASEGLTLASASAAIAAGTLPFTALDALIGTLAYTFEIYFDFSGYSDMAVGVSLMLNIELPVNFDSPYKALSISDFWKRWHMTLTAFFTRYVYIPLGGNRKGILRTCINILAVFILSGMWHGSSLTFILWGLLHGLFSVFDRLAGEWEKKLPVPLRWFITFTAVSLLWLLFASGSVSQWLAIIRVMFSFAGSGVSGPLSDLFMTADASFLAAIIKLFTKFRPEGLIWTCVYFLAAFLICLIPQNACRKKAFCPPRWAVISALLIFWGVISLAGETVFVYSSF